MQEHQSGEEGNIDSWFLVRSMLNREFNIQKNKNLGGKKVTILKEDISVPYMIVYLTSTKDNEEWGNNRGVKPAHQNTKGNQEKYRGIKK